MPRPRSAPSSRGRRSSAATSVGCRGSGADRGRRGSTIPPRSCRGARPTGTAAARARRCGASTSAAAEGAMASEIEVFFRALRAREFRRLDEQGQVYLDYTGSALYAESHVAAHAELLRGSLFGNPHSDSPASRASTDAVERARAAVLRFFDADPAEYAVIFTANASGALRLVGEAFPFAPGSRCVLSTDNHNSVNGIREFAARRGAG